MFWNIPIPVYCYVAAAVGVAALLIPRLREALITRWMWLAFCAFLLGGFVLLPSENHLMGDGLTHLGNPDRWIAATEPLDLALHHLAYLVTGSTIWAYRSIALIAGIFYLIGVTLMMRLQPTQLASAIVALAFLCTATIQFYFGYVESYSLLHVFTLYLIYFVWRDLQANRLTYWPLLFFLLALVSHFSGIVFLPAIVYLYRRRLGANVWLIVILVGVAGAIVALSADIFKVIVPFWPTDYSKYWLFSLQHLADLGNVLLLSAPAFFLAFWPRSSDRIQTFLILALAGAVAFTVLVDPKIGAFRDWDLLSIFALPLAALIALRAPRQPWVMAILAVAIALRVAPWIVFNSAAQTEFIKQVVEADIHYSADYDQGQRLVSWGLLLERVGDRRGGVAALEKRLQINPEDQSILTMLAPMLFLEGRYLDAYTHYLQVLREQPDDFDLAYRTVYAGFLAGRGNEVERIVRDLGAKALDHPGIATVLSGVYAERGWHEQALAVLPTRKLVVTETYLPYVIARSSAALGEFEQARNLVAIALEKAPADERLLELQRQLQSR